MVNSKKQKKKAPKKHNPQKTKPPSQTKENKNICTRSWKSGSNEGRNKKREGKYSFHEG